MHLGKWRHWQERDARERERGLVENTDDQATPACGGEVPSPEAMGPARAEGKEKGAFTF